MENNDIHECKDDPYMEDIAYCTEDEHGNLYVSNYQYQGNVNYCPFCGFKSRKKQNKEKEANEKDL